MNILIITGFGPKSIIKYQQYIVGLAEFLHSKSGNSVTLATPNEAHSLKEEFDHIQIGFKTENFLEFGSTFGLLSGSLKLHSILNKNSPDVLYCFGCYPYYLPHIISLFISKLYKIPLICEWMGSDLLLYDNKITKKVKKITLSNSNMNIVRTKEMRDKVFRFDSNSKVSILPSKGVNTEFFKKPEKNKKKNNSIKILYVGRLSTEKGVKNLIKSFEIVNTKHPKTKLLLVGDGKKKEKLMRLADETQAESNIKFIGRVEHSETLRYYHISDIFVNPSLSEGLPNAVMEAMACGLPIVATKVGGNRELVEEKKGGFLFEPKGVDQLARYLSTLIEDKRLREKQGRYNVKKVKEEYDMKKVMEKKKRLIKSLIK